MDDSVLYFLFFFLTAQFHLNGLCFVPLICAHMCAHKLTSKHCVTIKTNTIKRYVQCTNRQSLNPPPSLLLGHNSVIDLLRLIYNFFLRGMLLISRRFVYAFKVWRKKKPTDFHDNDRFNRLALALYLLVFGILSTTQNTLWQSLIALIGLCPNHFHSLPSHHFFDCRQSFAPRSCF